MVLELSEAQFSIVGGNGNVAVGEGDPEIPRVGRKVGHDHAKGAIKLCSNFGGCHEVDGDGVFSGLFGSIENELVFPSFLDKVVLWCKEYVQHKSSNPRWLGDNKIAAFLFVHSFHVCIEFLHDGWVVALLPIGHEFFCKLSV